MRGVSTVLDVSVFLLLVSAAVATLAVPAATPPQARADETANALATATGNVTYGAGGPVAVREPTRTADGTLAALLGRAAVASLRLDGSLLAPSAGPYRAAVSEEVETALAWTEAKTSVVATWEPYPDAPIRGRVAVGSPPPPGVGVSTATLTVPVGLNTARPPRRAAAADGYRGVAATVVDGLLQESLATGRESVPPAGGAVRRDWERRLLAYAEALDVSVADEQERTVERVRDELVARVTADLRREYDAAAAAADAVDVGKVQVVVREWSS